MIQRLQNNNAVHMRFLLLFLCFLMLRCQDVFSQEAEFRLTLRDGNIMTGTSKINNVSLQTAYGKLEIPIKNVTSIELGIAPSKEKDKIILLLKQLSNSDEKMATGAYEELLKMDIGAIPVINDYLFSEEYASISASSDPH